MYTYLLINLLSVTIPFLAGFDRRLRFHREWKFLFPGIAIMAIFFIAWDILFTRLGVWGFNPRYLTGIKFINLPIEEVLFFLCIPYASIFTYHALRYIFPGDRFRKASPSISWSLVMILAIAGIAALPRLYTSVTFLLTAGFIAYIGIIRKEGFLSYFYFSYLFILIPFFLVNGLLTGSWIPEQVVWYDDTQNLGIRLFTIPIEDAVYGMLMLMMAIFFMERIKNRKSRPG